MSGPPLVVRFERLAPHHDRAAFDCGNATLTDYIRRYARQDERKDFAACFVAVEPDSTRIAGYCTISANAALRDEIGDEAAKGLPRHDRIPAYLIGRLARDVSMRGRGLGRWLLFDALLRLSVIEAAGHLVIVDPIDGDARTFYERFGFAPLGGAPNRLYLPMASARDLVRG